MGLEDLEGCERFFSKSNALASSIRYASIFHRKQKIVEYMRHMDQFETSQNISKSSPLFSSVSLFTFILLGEFLVNNYKQALEILNGRMALKKTMEDQGIASLEVFECWLEEEQAYLRTLAKEPIHETLEMGSYEALANLKTHEYVVIILLHGNL